MGDLIASVLPAPGINVAKLRAFREQHSPTIPLSLEPFADRARRLWKFKFANVQSIAFHIRLTIDDVQAGQWSLDLADAKAA